MTDECAANSELTVCRIAYVVRRAVANVVIYYDHYQTELLRCFLCWIFAAFII